MTWQRAGRGRQVSTDGRYAVAADGYGDSQSIGAETGTGYEGFQGGEWASVYYPAGDALEADASDGDNLDWFPTMREAKAYCERHAREQARA